MDLKLLFWMLKGTVEINEVFRYIDREMLVDVVLLDYKEIVLSLSFVDFWPSKYPTLQSSFISFFNDSP